jgi:hypothetical protein
LAASTWLAITWLAWPAASLTGAAVVVREKAGLLARKRQRRQGRTRGCCPSSATLNPASTSATACGLVLASQAVRGMKEAEVLPTVWTDEPPRPVQPIDERRAVPVDTDRGVGRKGGRAVTAGQTGEKRVSNGR